MTSTYSPPLAATHLSDSVNNMLHRVLKTGRHPKGSVPRPPSYLPGITVDIKAVSSMLDHFSAGFNLGTYTHVTTAAQEEAANTMGGVLGQ